MNRKLAVMQRSRVNGESIGGRSGGRSDVHFPGAAVAVISEVESGKLST